MSPFRRFVTAAGLAWRAAPVTTAVVFCATLALGAGPVAAALFGKLLIDHLSTGSGAPATLAVLAAGLGGTLLVTHVGDAAVRYLEDQHARRIEMIVQERLFAKLNSLPGLELFERPNFHDRIQLALRAGQGAPQQLVGSARSLVQSGIQLIGFVGVLMAVSRTAALLLALATIPRLVAERRLARDRVGLLSALSPAQRRRFFYSRLQYEPRAAKELRVFGLGGFFQDRMRTELTAIHVSQRGLDLRILRVQALLDAATVAAMALAAYIVVADVAAARGTPGDLAIVLTALPVTAGAATAVVRQLAAGSEALLSIGHYLDIMTTGGERPGGVAVPALKDEIVFDDVWFRYGDDLPWVLNGVSFRIPLHRSVALVGANGAGKSTIVKLLAGLYEPAKGRILWDGIELSRLDPASLRRRIGMVFQDYMTYDLTALENIGVGDLETRFDLARISGAARLAGVDDVVGRLPRGYDTMLSLMHFSLGEEDDSAGVSLSGGQWQRIALARMLLRADRDLLILDEPSAGLDPEAEYQVHRVVHEHSTGTTRLLVSHRLSAVRMADRIVVVEDGRVSETGSHADLLRTGGRYADLFRLQAAGYQDVPRFPSTGPMTEAIGMAPNSLESSPEPASPTT
ncbi:ATP-binding cassette, subfamily B [Nonomuraea solani]|uniref:ATP-binding cassette, subfamily B n=1 Tax=Nonomuraea solani TaxID=1144553 RepID=A0A1H6CJB2_9ACTN|nr:ABC transporter ATP-binding protein [Nonomuraea solani]SEG72853.1 ATP-binding cassette, subfamily B [Nonomuraea solani]